MQSLTREPLQKHKAKKLASCWPDYPGGLLEQRLKRSLTPLSGVRSSTYSLERLLVLVEGGTG